VRYLRSAVRFLQEPHEKNIIKGKDQRGGKGQNRREGSSRVTVGMLEPENYEVFGKGMGTTYQKGKVEEKNGNSNSSWGTLLP